MGEERLGGSLPLVFARVSEPITGLGSHLVVSSPNRKWMEGETHRGQHNMSGVSLLRGPGC